jgi:hypothetical protein
VDATELRAKLAALAEFDVTEYEEPGGLRISRSLRARVAVEAPDVKPEKYAPEEGVVIRIPSIPVAEEFGSRSAYLDAIESELDRVGA